jgi:hypothetical protein
LSDTRLLIADEIRNRTDFTCCSKVRPRNM